jgi:hypothetical protein
MGIFKIFKEIKDFSKDVDTVFNEVMHDGKEYFGEVSVQDSSGNLWYIKVRQTGDRGRYLKIYLKNGSQKMRATADNYKDYVRITPDEWEIFMLLARNSNDTNLYYKAKPIISRITR